MSRKTTSLFLKECIADALLTLMEQKPLDAITIQEITVLADVGRVTYYRHFGSKEDVLDFKLELLVEQWIEKTNIDGKQFFPQKATSYFEFILSNQRIIKAIYYSKREHLLHDYINIIMQSEQKQNRLDEYKSIFYASGLYGITVMWIDSGFHESPEEMSALLTEVYKIGNL